MAGIWGLRYDGVDAHFDDASGIYLRQFPTPGTPVITDQDSLYPYGDGTAMGVDTRGGRTIPLTFGIDGATEAEVRSRYAQLATWWRADAVRGAVGGVAELRSDTGRSALGRPRDIEPTDVFFESPMMTVEAAFRAIDDLWYGDELSATATLGYRAAGGITFPARFPLTTSPESDRSQVFTVGGDAATGGVYEITGPVTSPSFEIPGLLRYSFTGLRLAYDQWLTIDTRPWAREVYRNDGAPLGGALDTSSTLLAGAPIPPGQHEFLLRGTTTGTPRATVRWRDAHTTP
jgi:hypothetical protein